MPPTRRRYLLIALVVFLIEVAIAKGIIPGAFIRHSFGDVLVIVLIYFTIRGLTSASALAALAISLGAGLLVESLQAVQFADRLRIPRGSVLRIVLGDTASLSDLLMYAVGGAIAFAVDRRMLKAES
jgi:hypothetical protein